MARAAVIILNLLVPVIIGAVASGRQAQNPLNDTLAEVGGKVITANDLIERIALMPWPGKDTPGEKDSMRIRALASLVAEDILALEAVSRGTVADSLTRAHIQNLQKLLVRDALYTARVKSVVSVSDSEVRAGLARYAVQVHVQMISTRDRELARRIVGELRSGSVPDSVLAHVRMTPGAAIDTVVVRFGMLERGQEDAVYRLTPSAPVSDPVAVERLGWAVLRLLGSETNPQYAKSTVDERIRTTREKIRLRKEIDLADRYSAQVLAPRRAKANPDVFGVVGRTLRQLLLERNNTSRPEGPYRLAPVLDTAFVALGPHLGEKFVTIGKDGLTLGDVLESWRTLDLSFPTLEEKDFLVRLNADVRKAVALELLSREGFRQRFDRELTVEHDLATWSEYWNATATELDLVRNISLDDKELLDTLVAEVGEFGNNYEVNVREILADSLNEAQRLLETLAHGADMRHIARKYSHRKDWAAHDGESGFFPVIHHPQIGVRALAADTGMLVGPVRVPEGYSVFTVLGVRRKPGDTVYAFSSVRRAYQEKLLFDKRENVLNDFIAAKAGAYRVRMRLDRLRNVEIPATNLVTKRLLGFGGSMLAAPPLTPLWHWLGKVRTEGMIIP